MKFSFKFSFTLVAAGCMFVAGPGTCQVEVISPEQATAFRTRLARVAAQTSGTAGSAWQGHMERLLLLPANRVSEEELTHRNRAIASAVRVAEDASRLKLAPDALFLHYRVGPMRSVMRMPDTYPVDGEAGAPVQIVQARDEYEPGSFLLHAFQNAERVQLTLGEFKSATGEVFPADQVDLKVVKVWYQNGNGWYSYFQDPGLELVPELLLHDENLVRVDTHKRANYARLNGPTGPREVWISPPKEIDPGFDAHNLPFADAETLQPVSLRTGEFKQFVLTSHATKTTAAGLYKGRVLVNAPGMPESSIPVEIKVLDYELPSPRANQDVNKNFIVSIMGAWPRLKPEHKAFLPTLKNLRRHNVLHIGPNAGPATLPEVAARHVSAMKEAGLATDFIIGEQTPGDGSNNAPLLTYDDLIRYRKLGREYREFYDRHFGHHNASLTHGDEQNARWVMRVRPLWRVFHEQGLKTELAGHDLVFVKGGHMLDVFPSAGAPHEAQKSRVWNAVGHASVGFYANQHTGSENPDFVRRQHGLLGYLANYDMVNNYEFAYGPWNDRGTELYKPMVLAYPTSEGLVDTLAWEGFREGIDDIRYASRLRQLANEAISSGDLSRVYAGRKVRQWFALMDGTRADLDTVRMEMILKIGELEKLAARP